ncbi:MAG: Fic family protein [candidate division WWE3 bacterium]|nr:Fic family protein [candidate division WWE3 bacterium]
MKVGTFITQPGGFKAFVPELFPPQEEVPMDIGLINLLNKATHSLGKLDGITQTLPNLSFFIFMYVRKEAALSSEIEGTRATMIDSIKAELEESTDLPDDVDDIFHYIKAMDYGLQALSDLPLSLRLIKDVHRVLLTGGRHSQPATPGEFRKSQNWIGGATPDSAKFVPPPVHEMLRSLGELELFLKNEDGPIPSLIKIGLAHAQFETIHPFRDGNGRTGRLLVTFYLCEQGALEKPVLYLSEFFKKNRDLYFDLLNNYHNKGEVLPWLTFFLEGVTSVAEAAIKTSKKIDALRNKDIERIQSFGGKSTKPVMAVLNKLYELPIVNVSKVQEWAGFSSRSSANELVDKLVKVGILKQRDESKDYARTFAYQEYLDAFATE